MNQFNHLPRVSLVGKLTRILVFMIGVTLLVATITLFIREYRDLQSKLDEKLELTADMIGQNSSVAIIFDDKITAQEILRALEYDPEIIYAALESATGEALAEYRGHFNPRLYFWMNHLPKTRQVTRPIWHRGKVVGEITLSADLKKTYDLLLHNALINAFIVWLALSVAGIFVLRLQHVFLKPILRLADTARQIERDHDYNKRSDYIGNDEISDLAEAFNSMLIEIQRTENLLEAKVSERTRQLEAATHEAEAANAAKSQFLANMSHEIRTPMNAIYGLIELSLKHDLEPKIRNYLRKVEISSRSLMHIIDDILDISKLEAAKMEFENIPFSLEELLEQIRQINIDKCASKGLQLTFCYSRLNHLLIGDPRRLQQILVNLIGNAIKFTEQGEIKVGFSEISRQGNRIGLVFTVMDTGIGIDPEHMPNLFKPFSQGDSSVTRNYGGTGLGLYIARQLIERMDGNIRVVSEKGLGSTFIFTVYLETDVSAPEPPDTGAALDINEFAALNGAKVLLVEDNLINSQIAVELLGYVNVQVDVAENGELALTKLRSETYDCVMMDVHMPVMDGCKTTQRLRQMPEFKTLPIIAMSASVPREEQEKCRDAGMDDFISKPITQDLLYTKLLKWLRPIKI